MMRTTKEKVLGSSNGTRQGGALEGNRLMIVPREGPLVLKKVGHQVDI
jgi:hypothetical protein